MKDLTPTFDPDLRGKYVQVHAKLDVRHAFVALESDIEKLWRLLEEPCPLITATAHCKDGLVRHFTDLQALVGYENPTRASITALEFSARSADRETTAEVTLGMRYSASISASLRGEETPISSLRTSLADVLDGMRPWYSRIATVDLFYAWFPIFMASMLVFQLMSSSSTPKVAVPFEKAFVITFLAVGSVAVIGYVIWGTSRLRSRFFQVSTFAIGQGLGRHQFNEQIRWVVIVGFLVSVVASIIVAPMLVTS